MARRRTCFLIFSSLNRHYSSKKNNMVFSIRPPSSVKGMTSLEREKFTSVYKIPCLKFNNVCHSEIMPMLKKYILKLRNWKSVQKNGDFLMVYIDPVKICKFEDFDERDRNILLKYIDKLEETEITIRYENWSVEEIFEAVIPPEIEKPSSFTKVGHIVHLNLRENQLPFKNIIGQVYLDAVAQTRLVVNKLNNIDTEFRNFSMEVLAGDGDTVTTVKENNCIFKFDFAKVYWNSRLATEHERLIKLMKNGDVLYDVFAGVGPFAVPAARKGITVLANDLNPESYKWLDINAEANKAKNLSCFNKDGRDFLKQDVKLHLLNRRNNNSQGYEHIAMNLPALAIEFLDVFHDWMDTEEEVNMILKIPPIVHLYCFVKANKNEDPKQIAKELVENKLNTKFSPQSLQVMMGKNRTEKGLRMRNVFKVSVKRPSSKSKVAKKEILNRKINKSSSTKHKEKIKNIDQQLINLRNEHPHIQAEVEEKALDFSSGVTFVKKSKVPMHLNDDSLKQLKI